MKADLKEARRLLDLGYHLVKLKPETKQPEGDEWNAPRRKATSIDPNATGYGLPLAFNKMVSIDPDNWLLAVKGMRALGLDLEKIMAAGVRTISTRPGSGGRSTFAEEPDLSWLKFASRDPKIGTVLELRASSENLQDVVPGLIYRDKTGAVRSQQYANGKRLDDLPPLPDDLMDWWQRCSVDIEFLREQQAIFMEAIGATPNLANSTGKGGKITLAYSSPKHRQWFNRTYTVDSLLDAYGYEWHAKLNRWSCPTASGAPGIREIPGRPGLWHSDHASDPLSGTFDAWIAFVVLEHGGNLLAAQDACDELQATATYSEEVPQIQEQAKPEQPSPIHPLARYVDYSTEIVEPVVFLIDDVIEAGFSLIAGSAGAGKTTQMIPLFARCTHLVKDDPARPVIRRRVIYIAEDTRQAVRVVTSMRKSGELQCSDDELHDWFRIVKSRRLKPDVITQVVRLYSELTYTNIGDSGEIYEAPPLIVFDTGSSSLELGNENDNSEVANAIATLKDKFGKFPVVVVVHVAKALKRSDVKEFSARGAGAWEADVQQVLYLTKEDDDSRWLEVENAKHRFATDIAGIRFSASITRVITKDVLGNDQKVVLIHGEPELVRRDEREEMMARSQAKKQEERDNRRTEQEGSLRLQILEYVRRSWATGRPAARKDIYSNVVGKRQTILEMIDSLIAERWLWEVEIPTEYRSSPRGDVCLSALSSEEFSVVIRENGQPPAEKLTYPVQGDAK